MHRGQFPTCIATRSIPPSRGRRPASTRFGSLASDSDRARKRRVPPQSNAFPREEDRCGARGKRRPESEGVRLAARGGTEKCAGRQLLASRSSHPHTSADGNGRRHRSSLPTVHESILIGRVSTTGVIRMPIFEYVCQQCQHEFETLVFGRDQAKCPECQSTKLAPQLSVFAVSAKGSSSAQLPTCGGGSCGDPRGPGACSLRDLD
jgi:putative FmdB family regulatory protein